MKLPIPLTFAPMEAESVKAASAGRAESMEQRQPKRGLASAQADSGGSGAIRPLHCPPFPSRHAAAAMAAGEKAAELPDRAGKEGIGLAADASRLRVIAMVITEYNVTNEWCTYPDDQKKATTREETVQADGR